MTIQLAGHTAERIAELVSNGTFLNASDAVETAVRYFHAARYSGYSEEELREIEEAVATALAQAERGELIPIETVFAKLGAKRVEQG